MFFCQHQYVYIMVMGLSLMPKLFKTLIFYLCSSLLHQVAEFCIKSGGSNQIDIAF